MNSYQKIYADLGFERTGLFKCIQKEFGCLTALYPGSSAHITPSFFIPHVVYVDRHPDAAAFFADRDALQSLVDRRKTYRRKAFIQFIAADYSQPLPLPDGSFDLLIELFAGQVAAGCARYLRPGGLLLTNQHPPEDAPFPDDLFHLTAVIRFHSGSYQVSEVETTAPPPAQKLTSRSSLRQAGERLVYREQEFYRIYRRV